MVFFFFRPRCGFHPRLYKAEVPSFVLYAPDQRPRRARVHAKMGEHLGDGGAECCDRLHPKPKSENLDPPELATVGVGLPLGRHRAIAAAGCVSFVKQSPFWGRSAEG